MAEIGGGGEGNVRAKKGIEQFDQTLADRRRILAKVEELSGETTGTLRRLQKRLGVLEKDVAQVHDQTRQLHSAHANMGLAMQSLREIAVRMRVVQPLLDMVSSGTISDDIEGFMGALSELNASIAYVRSHFPPKDVPELITALQGARSRAIAGLEGEYSRLLADQRPGEGEGWEQSQGVRALVRLRDAISDSEASECVDIYLRTRTRALATMMRTLEERLLRDIKVARSGDLQGERYERGRHPFLAVPGEVVAMLRSEVRLASLALPDGEEHQVSSLCQPPVEALARICGESLGLEGGRGGSVLPLLDAMERVREGGEALRAFLGGLGGDGEAAVREYASMEERVESAAAAALTRLPNSLKNHGLSHGAVPAPTAVSACPPATSAVLYAVQVADMRAMYQVASQHIQRIERKRQKLGGYLAELLEAAASHVTASVERCKDERVGRVYGAVNMHVLVAAVRPGGELDGEVSQADADALKATEAAHRTALLQRVWEAPLQQLSHVHIPSSLVAAAGGVKFSRDSRHQVKGAFSGFNAELDKILVARGEWRVRDDGLRGEMAEEHTSWVLPVYEAFYRNFASLPFSRHPDKYVRFTPDGIKGIIQDQLFRGD